MASLNMSLHQVKAAMVGSITVLCLFASIATSPRTVQAQTKKKPSLAPSQFIGKSFEECEKILGKPTLVEKPHGNFKHYARTYKSSIDSLTRLKLMRLPEGSMDGPVPKRVNSVQYHFAKDKVKTWQEALAAIRVSAKGLSADKQFPEIIHGKADGCKVEWTLAEESTTMPAEFRHPDENVLILGKRLLPDKPR